MTAPHPPPHGKPRGPHQYCLSYIECVRGRPEGFFRRCAALRFIVSRSGLPGTGPGGRAPINQTVSTGCGGRVSVNVDPWPSSLSTVTCPPCISTKALTTLRPRPRPRRSNSYTPEECRETSNRVENGAKTSGG